MKMLDIFLLNKKIHKTLLLDTLFLLGGILYFSFYNRALFLNYSLLSILFALFLILHFVIFAHLTKKKIWLATNLFLFFIFLLYGLVNFAYFKIFNTFLGFKLTQQFTQIDLSLLGFLKDFYFLIPAHIYILTALLFLFFAVFSIIFRKINNQKIFLLLHNYQSTKPNNRVFFLFLILINISVFSLIAFYQKNPRPEWWDTRQYSADYGLAGNLYNELYQALNKKNEITSSANAATENDGTDVAGPTSFPKVQTKVDQTKIFMDNLSKLQNNNNQITPQLPEVKNPNIIIYQLESVDSWALRQDPSPMPYLKNLIENNVSVDHFSSNSCETINAEFSSLCSFLPDSEGPISTYSNNDYYCLPSLLKEKFGYKTQLFHANTLDFWNRDALGPKWGFDELFFTPYFEQKTPDYTVLDEVVKKIKESDKPTFNYVIGFTSHDPHTQDAIDYYSEKYGLSITPYSEPLSANSAQAETDETTIRNYFGFLKAIDDGVKNLFDKLKENNLMDNTIVVLYGDHRFYRFPQDSLENFYNYNEIPLAIYIPNQGKIKLQKFASQIDIAPTLLNLIEGENYKQPSNFLGTSLFSPNYPNSVITKCLGEIDYQNAETVIKGNSKTNLYQKFYPADPLPSDLLTRYIENLKGLVKTSDEVIYTNALTKINKDEASSENEQLLGGQRFAAHALGGIEGADGTNSLEAFQYNYDQGKRVFEVDLYTTKDNEVVAFHGPSLKDLFGKDLNISDISKKDFLQKKIDGKFTPLDLDQLLNLLNDHQDMFLIIDTKDLDNYGKIYQQIVLKAKELNPAILDRIIPQIYYESDLAELAKIYNFQTIIYALYRIEIDPQKILLFTQKNKNIKFITVDTGKYLKAFVDLLKANNVLTFVNTVNDATEIKKYLDDGVYGIFTDFYAEPH